jgi:hypothetical protein
VRLRAVGIPSVHGGEDVKLCAVFSFPPTTLAAENRKTFSSFEIKVASRNGFFPSPVYTVSIVGSGRVNYRGYDRVHWKGKRHARISRHVVEQLVEHVRASNFFDLPSSYDNGPCLSIDGSGGSLRIRLDGREKSVGTCGAPSIVDQLMTEVESAAWVWRWVYLDPDELRLKIHRGWSVSEHMPKIMEGAIDWDAAEIIRILVHNGADMNFLMDAARDGRAEATRALLDLGADWKVEGSNGENPATDASFRGPDILLEGNPRGCTHSGGSSAP